MTTLFTEYAERALKDVAQQYALKLLPVDESTLLLVGRDFAVAVLADFDTVHVAYIEPEARGGLRSVGIKPYLQDTRFTADDRAQFGHPVGRDGYLRASLNVIASGLAHACDDILRGDRRWLNLLRARDPQRWAGGSPDPRTSAALASVLVPQAA